MESYIDGSLLGTLLGVLNQSLGILGAPMNYGVAPALRLLSVPTRTAWARSTAGPVPAAPCCARSAWRLIPFLGLLYFFAFLDRVNVGFAALTMNEDIGLSAAAYGFGAGIFFIGYVIFESRAT